MKFKVFICAFLIGCGSSDDDVKSGTPLTSYNPCLTKGASYLIHMQQVSGDCGNVADQVLNISSSGNLPQSTTNVVCDSSELDKCTIMNTNCTFQIDKDCSASYTSTMTIADDGASGSGFETITIKCNDGSWCQSTYKVTATRI